MCVCPMLVCFVGLSSLGANQDCNDSFCESMVVPPLFAALQRHAAALTMHLGRSGLARYRAVSVAIDTPTGPEPPRHRFRPTVTVTVTDGRRPARSIKLFNLSLRFLVRYTRGTSLRWWRAAWPRRARGARGEVLRTRCRNSLLLLYTAIKRTDRRYRTAPGGNIFLRF